jgi:hypothetical protein
LIRQSAEGIHELKPAKEQIIDLSSSGICDHRGQIMPVEGVAPPAPVIAQNTYSAQKIPISIIVEKPIY